MLNKKIILLLIFLLALILRFLYFPQNTYFGFDQARDAFASLEILKGDLKIVGPPTANEIFHHGVLYYYIFAPIYYFSGGDPTYVSFFLRIFNALGVFLLFAVTLLLFDKKTALIAAFLFAVSFEQTQFALFLNHPSLAVISVLLFYLGLGLWIFKKLIKGFYLALFGLGLSIQFEFVETQLIAVFVLFLILFRKSISNLKVKDIAFGILTFSIPVSSYIISEIKNNFLFIQGIRSFLNNSNETYSLISQLNQIPFTAQRHFHDNLAANNILSTILGFTFLGLVTYLIYKKIYIKQLIFLSAWFLGGFLVYFFIKNDAYFYNTGTSIALLVFAAFLISKVYSKSKLLAFSILFLIFISNIFPITKQNPMGPNQKINPQIGLLLSDEQKVLDFIYQNANGEDFAVNALTMPYNVNTTWSYLFEWYGKKKYRYVPVWGGDAAEGYEGNLEVETARSKLPDKRFLIIEPTEGIHTYLVEDFLKSEEIYAETKQKEQFGTIQVWVQQGK